MRKFFKGFRKGSIEFGHNLSIIINSILLSVVYVLGVGVTSLVANFLGKQFLEKAISKQKKTYWSDINLIQKRFEEYYRQF